MKICTILKGSQFCPSKRKRNQKSQKSGSESHLRWTLAVLTTLVSGTTSSTYWLNLVASWASSGGFSRPLWLHGTPMPSTTSWLPSSTKLVVQKRNSMLRMKAVQVMIMLRSWGVVDGRIAMNISSHGCQKFSNAARQAGIGIRRAHARS